MLPDVGANRDRSWCAGLEGWAGPLRPNAVSTLMLQTPSGGVAAATLLTGSTIYVTPKVTEKRLDSEEYLKHELSHAVLHQNQSLPDPFAVARQQWCAEGLAVLFGEQKSYVSPEELVSGPLSRELGPIIDPERGRGAPTPRDMRFAYQVWRYFLENLLETRGDERFQRFLKVYIGQPRAYREQFSRTFGVSLGEAIRTFQGDVRSGRWKPAPGFVARTLERAPTVRC
jgi:hypothetical protein